MDPSRFINPIGAEGAPVERAIAPAVESPRPIAPARTGWKDNLVPLAVASALFMEFIDSTALSTALPTLARAFHSDPIHLKLALTSYLLALAVGAPASGWVADKCGARRVFLSAMAVFLAGSVLCALAHSVLELVGARLVQGLGGAMMTPVGRVIIVGSTPRDRFVSAMSWFTMPALVGPLLGPPLAGFVLGVASWHWIFLINLPIGLLAVAAVLRLVPKIERPDPGRFDSLGFAYVAVAITGLVLLAETGGTRLAPPWLQASAAAACLVGGVAFVRHALRVERPVMNVRLLRLGTYRISLIGGTLVRLGVGASPLLLPLLLQIGLGWSPVRAGFVTIAQSIGALALKPTAARMLRRFGYRNVLLVSAATVGASIATPAFFTAATPMVVMALALAVSGFSRSAHFTAANALAYAEVPAAQVSQASTLATVVQQIGMSVGVSLGGLMLHLAQGRGPLAVHAFFLPFLVIGASSILAAPLYLTLSPDAGAELGGRGSGARPAAA